MVKLVIGLAEEIPEIRDAEMKNGLESALLAYAKLWLEVKGMAGREKENHSLEENVLP